MKKILNSSEMKACDTFTIQQMQVPSLVLMERAALAVKETLLAYYGKNQKILVLCGSGNNGGDGFAVARLLLFEGIAADVYFMGKESSMTEECCRQRKIFENYGGKIRKNIQFSEYTLVVDALLGIGLSRPIKDSLAELIRQLNASGLPVAAVDIPTGISADTGQVLGDSVHAELTITFSFAKTGQLLCPGAVYCGKLIVKEIGIGNSGFPENYPFAFTYETEDLQKLPKRTMHSHKGTYGKVLVIAGAAGMAGAALLSAKAAYRTGCGLVKLFSDESNRLIFQQSLPEALTAFWQQEHALENSLSWADAVVIGPGLGTSSQAQRLLQDTLYSWKGALVIDADALNLMAEDRSLFEQTEARIIATPHPLEMARLLQIPIAQVLADLIGTAKHFARTYHAVCVLKDARTVVTDGTQVYLNRSGTHGMAVGGSGDVLTGIISGLLAQGMNEFEAACMGVYLHGLAGEKAARQLGPRGMLAGDLADCVGKVLKSADKSIQKENKKWKITAESMQKSI